MLLAAAVAAALIAGLWMSIGRHLPARPLPVAGPVVLTPETAPGLDCGLSHVSPASADESPCASAAVCGSSRVPPLALHASSRRQPVCVIG
jgi:hypothetical protein